MSKNDDTPLGWGNFSNMVGTPEWASTSKQV